MARIRANTIDEVVLSPRLSAERIGDLVELCAEAGLPAFVPIDHGNNPDLELPPPTVETVGHSHFVVYHRRLGNASTLLLKSIIDRVLAAVMIVLLAPLMLLVALLVRIFIGPQILHIRRRGGLFGRPFSMLKFRTMRLGAESEQARARREERDGRPGLQDGRRPARHASRPHPAPHQPRRAAAAVQRAGRAT